MILKLINAVTLIGLAMLVTGVHAQSVSTQFNSRDGVGAKISADGNNLLVDDAGAGFYIIASQNTVDDTGNLASFVPYNSDGVMRPMNGASAPYLPYSFKFTRDPRLPNRLYFAATIGPGPYSFATASLPIDGRAERFFFWRYPGYTLSRYDQNPYSYRNAAGDPVFTYFAPGSPSWGEMIGAEYTVRVTITQASRPLGLAFVHSPNLSSGVNNIEFRFGSCASGQRISAQGFIDVSRTDLSQFVQQPLKFECEAQPYHQIGRADAGGWSARVGDPVNRYLEYGPYTTDVLPGSRTATFRLMLDNTTADNNRLLVLDVFDSDTGRTLASRNVTRREFAHGLQYQDFNVSFSAPAGHHLEFRTLYLGGSYVRQDYVLVQ